MHDPPGYLWAITLAGVVAIPAATCAVLFSGAVRAGAGRRRAGVLAGVGAAVPPAWFAASAVIAGQGWYQAKIGHRVPWLPVAALGLLALALPAGVGDVATALAAPFVARRLERDSGRRSALWLNAFGPTDLVLVISLGALTGFQLIAVDPSTSPITQLPLALIPTAVVPLLFALRVTSVSALTKPPLRATAPLPA